jgi:hypothetical protein
MEKFIAYWPYLAGLLLFVGNEILAANPSLKSNSIFQLVLNVLKSFGPKAISPDGK